MASRQMNSLRRKILRDRGLDVGRYGKPKELVLERDNAGRKTLAMSALELAFGKPIEELVMDGDLVTVSNRLGVTPAAVSKWRLRLGLRD